MISNAAQISFFVTILVILNLVKGDTDAEFVKERLRKLNEDEVCRECRNITNYFEDPNKCKETLECIKTNPDCYKTDATNKKENHLRVNCDPEKLKAWKCRNDFFYVSVEMLPSVESVKKEDDKRMEKLYPCITDEIETACENKQFTCAAQMLPAECKLTIEIERTFCGPSKSLTLDEFFDYALGKTPMPNIAPLPNIATSFSLNSLILVFVITKFLINKF